MIWLRRPSMDGEGVGRRSERAHKLGKFDFVHLLLEHALGGGRRLGFTCAAVEEDGGELDGGGDQAVPPIVRHLEHHRHADGEHRTVGLAADGVVEEAGRVALVE